MQHNQISIERQQLNHLDQQLLNAVSNGASNKHIALMLSKSEFTIRNRLSRVYRQISVTNRAQAAVWYHDYVEHMSRLQPATNLGTAAISAMPSNPL